MRKIEGVERYPNGRIKRRYSDLSDSEKESIKRTVSENRRKKKKVYHFELNLVDDAEIINMLSESDNITQTIKKALCKWHENEQK